MRKVLPQKNYVCCDITFVMMDIILSRQAYFCRDKHVFVMTKHVFCPDISMPVATKICRNKHNVVVKKLLL